MHLLLLSAFLAFVGCAIVATSRVEVCENFHVELAETNALFPLERLPAMRASLEHLERGRADALGAIERAPLGFQPEMAVLVLEYCESCKQRVRVHPNHRQFQGGAGIDTAVAAPLLLNGQAAQLLVSMVHRRNQAFARHLESVPGPA